MERSLYEGERKNAVDALFSRIFERAVARSRRKGAEGRREAKERKKELLKGWAVATGNWHTSVSDFTDSAEPFSRGTDSDVYVSKDGNSVIKVSKGKDNTRFPSDIDAYNLFNFIFPNSAYRIVGYGEIDGKFVTFLEQPIIDLSNAVQLTKAERIDFMRDTCDEPTKRDELKKLISAISNGAIEDVKERAKAISGIEAEQITNRAYKYEELTKDYLGRTIPMGDGLMVSFNASSIDKT